jgi:hypothetical protein
VGKSRLQVLEAVRKELRIRVSLMLEAGLTVCGRINSPPSHWSPYCWVCLRWNVRLWV